MNEVLAAEGLFDLSEWVVSVAATFGYRARDITKNLVDQLKKSSLGLNNPFSNKWAANAALFFIHRIRLHHLLHPHRAI